MLNYFFRRLLLFIPTLFFVLTLVFFLIHLIPGDPVDFILGESVQAQDRVRMVRALHLDQNLWVQYSYYLTNVLTLNLGNSLFDHTPVLSLISQRLLPTFLLAVCSMIVAMSIAFPLGAMAALRQGTWIDQVCMAFAMLGISIPSFYAGPLLMMLFSIKLGILPISGFEQIQSIVLPACTLGLAMAAMISRMTRASMLEVLKMDYVRTARAKGVSESVLVIKHVFRCALLPVITVVGLQFGTLLAGAVVTEKVFSWPGLGTLMITEIQRRNYPVVQGCVIFIATTYVLINMLTDFVYAKLDPRVRLS